MKRPKCSAVWCRPVYWEGAGSLMSGKTSGTWTKHHQACARSTFSLGTWTQARLKDHGLADEDLCQLCRAERGT
eukprot:5716292-Pyramimonas_sp.AAC.1